MPGDAGDDFGAWFIRTAMQEWNSMRLRHGGSGGALHPASKLLNLMGRTRSYAGKLVEQMRASTDGANAAMEALLDKIDKRYAYFAEEGEARDLARALEAEGLGHSIEEPGQKTFGFWRVRVPESSKLDSASSGLRGRVMGASLRNATQKAALQAACADAAKSLAKAIGPDAREALADMREFDFKTTYHDREGKLMRDRLEELLSDSFPGMEGFVDVKPVGKDTLRFKVPAITAPAVMELADAMSKTIYNMPAGRWTFPEGFADPALGAKVVGELSNLDPRVARQLASQMEEVGIDYHLDRAQPDGPVTMHVAYTHAQSDALADNLKALDPASVPDPSEIDKLQKGYEYETAAKALAEQPALERIARNERTRARRRAREATPEKVRKKAKDMSEAKTHGGEPRARTKDVSRGRK